MTFARPWAVLVLAAALVALFACSAASAGTTARPGDPEAGRKIFKDFCASCHNFRAVNSRSREAQRKGVAGSDLDVLKPHYSRVVTAIVQGEGGLAAEYFLRVLTFKQIYDVAAFVAKYAGKGGPPMSASATAGVNHKQHTATPSP
jgi:mono/diheme cytochrome c family protein